MPQFDSTTRTKLAALRTLRAAGTPIEVYELVKIEWPSPDVTTYYAAVKVDEVASVAPSVSPIEVRLVPGHNPSWFLPVTAGATIGDEEVKLVFGDFDGVMSDLLVAYGEGVKVTLLYWFPQETLLLPVWQGHLRNEDEAEVGFVTVKAVQGFRSADATLPDRDHTQECQAIFGGNLDNQAQIDEGDCPYNKHIGGAIGTNDPDTGLPWTFCPRRVTQDCVDRGVDPLFHLSHKTISAVVVNNQTHGPRLLSTSLGNETNLKEPVRVVMGWRRLYDMQVMAYRRDLNNNHPSQGFFYAYYEACEGPLPLDVFTNAIITVDDQSQQAVGLHYGYRRGRRGNLQTPAPLSTHGYSGTAYVIYNFGWVDPTTVDPSNCSAAAYVNGGLENVRTYTDDTTYTESCTSNRVWQIARMLCDKRWGFGEDYAILNKASWIACATWADTFVTFTDTFGGTWSHVRARSHVELIGRKVQQQFTDMCMAGRMSLPFIFNGEIHIEPLRALTTDELAAVPVFTDEGDTRNVIAEDRDGVEVSTLKISRASDLDLPNRIECTYDAAINDYLETPLAPVEDVDAQLRAGRIAGDFRRKKNVKTYNLLGVTEEAQALKIAWSLLDLGEFDQGGLQNNLTIKFKVWFADAIDLYPHAVFKYVSSRLTRYGFQYFRIHADGIKRDTDLTYEITAQAYPEDYMAAFETDYVSPPPIDPGDPGGGGTGGLPPGRLPGGGDGPPVCVLQFGDISHTDGLIRVDIDTC